VDSSELVKPYKIAIWCLPGKIKEFQVDRLAFLLNGKQINGITIQSHEQKGATIPNVRTIRLTRGCTENRRHRPSRIRRSINNQQHLLEIFTMNELQARHLPPEALHYLRQAHLIILIVDCSLISFAPEKTSLSLQTDKQINTSELRLLQDLVKKSSYYEKYQSDLKQNNDVLLKQSTGKNNTIDQSDYLWQIQKLLRALNVFPNPIALVVAGNSQTQAGSIFEDRLAKLPEVTQERSPNPLLMFRLFRSNNPQKESHILPDQQFISVNGVDDIILQQLEKREILRIERRKMVRLLFGKDTRKLYLPYYQTARNMSKHKPVVTKPGSNSTN